MEWLKNLLASIDYIESHLDQKISYDEAARETVKNVFSRSV